jgi:hypothetical protein
MHRRWGCCSCTRLDTGYAPQTAAFLFAVEVEKSGQLEACNGLKWSRVFHAPTSRGVPALQRLRMHDKAVGSSQSRGGLNDCDDLVRAGQGSGVARFRLPTPPAQGDDEWGRQYAQHAIYPRQQEEAQLEMAICCRFGPQSAARWT